MFGPKWALMPAIRHMSFSLLACVGTPVWAAAPVLYSQPAYESPVRGDADDLLLLPGFGLDAGDIVVFRAVSDSTRRPVHPAQVPTSSTTMQGTLNLVSVANAPYSLTVHLNPAMTAGQTYALWVVNATGEWSSPALLINDARPLWITPDSIYASEKTANLPRVLKVVGRNLQHARGNAAATRVKLIGKHTGTTYVLTANTAARDPTGPVAALERYVAAVGLPSRMAIDSYQVQVSRDGTSWVPLMGNGQGPVQSLTVAPDPLSSPQLLVSDPRFADPGTGPCQPNDGIDDTSCILRALGVAAGIAGGATVRLGPGAWTLSNAGAFQSGLAHTDRLGSPGSCTQAPPHDCGVTKDGVVIPPGVNLIGAGAEGRNATVIVRKASWPGDLPLFVVMGNNRVSGVKFVDEHDYATETNGAPILQLGFTWYRARMLSADNPTTVSNVVISQNVFDKPYIAIGSGALPADHIFITYNTFGGAWNTAIYVGQDRNEVRNLGTSGPYPLFPYQTYHYNDSITNFNTFYPSSNMHKGYVGQRHPYDGSGSIATQMNTGLRTDFSGNAADGRSTQYLYNPAVDAKGWRAAFFWSTGANQEMTLVSENVITCPGDKFGDGEAISFDGSVSSGGTPAAEPVVTAGNSRDSGGRSGTTMVLRGSVATLMSANGTVDIASNPTPYYHGMWALVVKGTGIGQWRKIDSVAIGADASQPTVSVRVTPALDVVPDTTSEVMIEHVNWQNATISNMVDQRSPTCTKGNSRGAGGILTWYDSTGDSAMEGNQLYDTDGILLNTAYRPTQTAIVTPGQAPMETSNDVRYNLIKGNYDWSNAMSHGSGIQLGYGACIGQACGCEIGKISCPTPVPPNLGFGVSIAWNTITQADTLQVNGNGPHRYSSTGAIGLIPNWSAGPVDSAGLIQWQLGESNLVFHNTLDRISNTMSGSVPGLARIGIGIDTTASPLTPGITWHTVTYANSCSTVDIPMRDFGIGTTRYCPPGAGESCECIGTQAVDLGVSARGGGATSVGEELSFVATVTNNDPSLQATGVALSLSRSAGISIRTMSVVPGSGSCDLSTAVCAIGKLEHGQGARVTVTGSGKMVGTWPITFSATHHDPDPLAGNNGATVTTTVGLPPVSR